VAREGRAAWVLPEFSRLRAWQVSSHRGDTQRAVTVCSLAQPEPSGYYFPGQRSPDTSFKKCLGHEHRFHVLPPRSSTSPGYPPSWSFQRLRSTSWCS